VNGNVRGKQSWRGTRQTGHDLVSLGSTGELMRILQDDGDTITYEDDDGRTFVVHRNKRRRRRSGTGPQTGRILLVLIVLALFIGFCF
jgi:hypothetical protein